MNIGDTILAKTEKMLGDEYETRTYHQASTIALALLPTFALIAGAMLAWVLPGTHAMWSLLIVIPLIGPNLIFTQWLKSRATRPAPKLKDGLWGLAIVNLTLCFVMLFGIAYNVSDPSLARGLYTGGIIGTVFAVIAVPAMLRKQRERDEERLNAELED